MKVTLIEHEQKFNTAAAFKSSAYLYNPYMAVPPRVLYVLDDRRHMTYHGFQDSLYHPVRQLSNL